MMPATNRAIRIFLIIFDLILCSILLWNIIESPLLTGFYSMQFNPTLKQNQLFPPVSSSSRATRTLASGRDAKLPMRCCWINLFFSLISWSFIPSRTSRLPILRFKDSLSAFSTVSVASLACFKLLRFALIVRLFIWVYCSARRIRSFNS